MASWAQRMHRRAADLGSVVTSCGHPGPGPYPHRLEKVKFGVPLDEVCKNDIPGPLLVLILKLNKEAPQRKDVFRAPGHQGAMKKLIHFLQAGRLVNVENYSVYTIASVLKKFLRKIPNGIFGRDGEAELFAIVELDNELEQQERIHRLIVSLPVYTQRLLVLLFGTFRVIASNADRAGTGMSSEALGVSVAPSFFQSCVSDGKTARMEDVLRFKVATKIMKQMIDQFATYDLFGRDNYEFYARVTGRILKVQDEWICSFRYPPPPRGKSAQQSYAVQLSLEAEKTWLQCECERWGLIAQEESQSTPALLTSSSSAIGNSALSLGIIPEHSLLESCARLSVSLEGPGVFALSSQATGSGGGSSNNGGGGGIGSSNGIKNSSSCSSTRSSKSASAASHHMTMDELRAVNRYAESTKSLSYLPQVHERQTARMRTRSEWFLGARGGSLELAAACAEGYQYFGGSTNDIQDTHQGCLGNNAMLLMLQHCCHQQQHQHHLQRMETDENEASSMMMMDTNFPPISGIYYDRHENYYNLNNVINHHNAYSNNCNNNNVHDVVIENCEKMHHASSSPLLSYNSQLLPSNVNRVRSAAGVNGDHVYQHAIAEAARVEITGEETHQSRLMFRRATIADPLVNHRPSSFIISSSMIPQQSGSTSLTASQEMADSDQSVSPTAALIVRDGGNIRTLRAIGNDEEVDYVLTANARHTVRNNRNNQNNNNDNRNQQQQFSFVSMFFTILDFLF